MLGKKGGVVALAALAVLAVGDTVAQEPPTRRGEGMHRGPAPEMILANRDRLELTEDQVAALDDVREQLVSVRSSHRAAMAELRSRFQAGEIERAEMLGSMEAIRSGGPDFHQEIRTRIESILDEDQLAAVAELQPRRGEMRGGGGQMRPGRGMRGERGQMRPGGGMRGGDGPGGMRGRGMGGGPDMSGGPMVGGGCPHGGPAGS